MFMVYENKDKLYPPFSSGIEWHNEFNIFFSSLISLKFLIGGTKGGIL
jgi:hypothetical protein